jgi:epoxyqueuosine reductase
MYNTELIREKIKNLGADLCGFASITRFDNAPPGFHPSDIYKKCETVIVFAKKVPRSSLFASNCVPYTHINNLITQEVDKLTLEIIKLLEEIGIEAVPIPSDDPYEYWEPENMYGRAILSLKHAAYLAGLGVIGKSTLLINNKYGNMIQFGAVLINIKMKEDPIVNYKGCIADCWLCIDSCPTKALDGISVNQKLCRQLSTYKTEKGYILKKCNLCRKICPNAFGVK